MARFGPIALVVALLAGTAAAFGVTASLKASPSPILETKVSKTFSPTCRCKQRTALIAFRLRHPDRLTLTIEDASGHTVRVLLTSRKVRAGLHEWAWNGLLDGGRRAPDGVYRPRVELDAADRVIVLPNRIVLDTQPPKVTVVGRPRLGGPGPLVVRYSVSEPARGLLDVRGVRVVRTYRVRLADTMRVTAATLRRVGAARGVVTIAAEDLAGNVSKPRRIGMRR